MKTKCLSLKEYGRLKRRSRVGFSDQKKTEPTNINLIDAIALSDGINLAVYVDPLPSRVGI
jgi:hypothetical protein